MRPMTREEVIEKVNNVLCTEFKIKKERLVGEAHLFNELEFDSLDAVDMIAHLGDSVEMDPDSQEFESIRTLNDVYNLVEKYAN